MQLICSDKQLNYLLIVINLQRRIQEKLIYEDLDSNCDLNLNTGPPLVLTHIDRYLHGPVSTAENNHDASTDAVKSVASQLMKEVEKWAATAYLPRHPSMSLVSPAAAVSALGELTPGGALMKGFREDSLGRKYNIYL